MSVVQVGAPLVLKLPVDYEAKMVQMVRAWNPNTDIDIGNGQRGFEIKSGNFNECSVEMQAVIQRILRASSFEEVSRLDKRTLLCLEKTHEFLTSGDFDAPPGLADAVRARFVELFVSEEFSSKIEHGVNMASNNYAKWAYLSALYENDTDTMDSIEQRYKLDVGKISLEAHFELSDPIITASPVTRALVACVQHHHHMFRNEKDVVSADEMNLAAYTVRHDSKTFSNCRLLEVCVISDDFDGMCIQLANGVAPGKRMMDILEDNDAYVQEEQDFQGEDVNEIPIFDDALRLEVFVTMMSFFAAGSPLWVDVIQLCDNIVGNLDHQPFVAAREFHAIASFRARGYEVEPFNGELDVIHALFVLWDNYNSYYTYLGEWNWLRIVFKLFHVCQSVVSLHKVWGIIQFYTENIEESVEYFVYKNRINIYIGLESFIINSENTEDTFAFLSILKWSIEHGALSKDDRLALFSCIDIAIFAGSETKDIEKNKKNLELAGQVLGALRAFEEFKQNVDMWVEHVDGMQNPPKKFQTMLHALADSTT